MNRRSLVALCLMGVAFFAGCDRPTPAPRTFTLKGVVRKVDVASGEVTIAHQAMPGFMAAMTMPFTIKDKATLDDLQVGDEVEGPIRVVFEGDQVKDYDLESLVITKPSLGPSVETSERPRPLVVGQAMPDFVVTTQEGATLKLSDLKGKVVALTFIYTRCPLPDFCPAIDARFAELARRVAVVPGRADGVRLLSVSFDPEHDTPAVLAKHAQLRGAKPPLWTFAVASHEQLRAVSGAVGLDYSPVDGQIAHNLRTLVIAPDGAIARVESGSRWDPAELFKAIVPLIPGPGK